MNNMIVADYKIYNSMPNFNLDPSNPPKYCPQCAWNGVKSKVKRMRLEIESNNLMIMCKNEQVCNKLD